MFSIRLLYPIEYYEENKQHQKTLPTHPTSKEAGANVTYQEITPALSLNEFYLLLHTPNEQAELGFLLPNHPTQKPLFQAPFTGQGVYLTIEVEEMFSCVIFPRISYGVIPIQLLRSWESSNTHPF